MHMAMFPALAILTLIMVAALVLCCALKPAARRVLARIFSVVALGAGAGLLVWGICAAALGESSSSRFGISAVIGSPSEAMGSGAGFLVAGVTALVLSFVGGCTGRESKA